MSEEKKQKGLLKSLTDLPFLKKLKSIKHIEIIILVIFFLILLLICFGSGNGIFTSQAKSQIVNANSTSYITTKDYVESLETKLKTVLSNIQNVGNVEVMVSVIGSTEIVFATDEKVTNNGQTTQTENKIIFTEQNGVSKPIVISEKLPEINGIVVVSSGAKDTKIKLDIISAVQTLLNIQANKIQVFVGN